MGVISEFMSNDEAHADQAAFSYRNTFFDDATAADKAARANSDITVKYCTCANVTVIFDDCVVVN